jgi:class 3 adenylate cyclase
VEAAGLCRGNIIADTGDGHMLTFRSCPEAILCGHLIQQRVRARNAALTDSPLQFDLHIGIDVVHAVPLADGNIRSDAANRAARVCSHSPAGEVYCTEDVARTLHVREVEVEKVGIFNDLKGVTGPVTLFRLIAWRAAIPRTSNPFV